MKLLHIYKMPLYICNLNKKNVGYCNTLDTALNTSQNDKIGTYHLLPTVSSIKIIGVYIKINAKPELLYNPLKQLGDVLICM